MAGFLKKSALAGRWPRWRVYLHAGLAVALAVLTGGAWAAAYTLPAGIGSGPFSACVSGGGSTYNCSGNVSIGSNDTVNFSASMTLNVAGNFTVANNSNLNGGAYTVNIVAGGSITLGNSNVSAVNFTAGGSFVAGNTATINGDITAGGNVTIGNGGSVTGDILAGGSLSIGSGTTVAGSCVPSHAACSSSTPTPLAEYRFDECGQYGGAAGEVVDTRGAYPGTPMGGLQNATPGQIQRYADFSAASRYANLSSGPTLGSAWTIAAWFKKPFAGSGTHSNRYYVLGSVAGGGDVIFLDRNNSYRWGVYTINASDSTGSGGTTNGTFNFGTLADGWHHVVLVGSGNTTRLYVDGTYRDQVGRQLIGTFRYVGASYDGAGTSSGQSFGTPLDEFKIYAGAMDASQVSSLYANELAGNNHDGSVRPPACPVMTIANASLTEGNSGSANMNFTVSLSSVAASTVTATYALTDGTATGDASCAGGIDYDNDGGTVTIASGSSSGTIIVPVCGDLLYEGNETFTVTLSSPVGATLGSPSGATGTITNDDAAPTISIAAASTTEGDSGTKSLSFTVTQSAASGLATTATYALTNGTATGGGCGGTADFVNAGGTVTIAAGATSGTIDVPICGDTTYESDETLTVTLSSPSNATLGTPSSATGTIVNDDVDPDGCFLDTFTGADGTAPSSDWKTSSSSGSFGQPKITGNRLRLTDSTTNVSTAAHLQKLFPGAGNKIVVEFDHFAYSGTGADGVAFAMSDATVTPNAGAYGGSLGYAQKTGINGFAGGWLGIGLDEYGNFANPTEGRVGGPGFTVDAVTVRGSGSGTSGYDYHATSGTLSPGIDAAAGGGGISYQGSGAQAAATSGNVTPALPAHAANDLLVCLVLSKDNVAHSATGWTQYYSLTNGTDLRGSLFYKIAGSASETAPTITHAGGNGIQARCSGFRGVDTASPFVVAYGTTNTSGDDKINTPSVNTSGTNSVMALIAGYVDNDAGLGTNNDYGLASNPQDISFSQAYYSIYNPATGSTHDSALTLFYATQPTGGTLGAYAIDTNSDEDSIGVLVALRPAPASASGYRFRITVDHTDGTHAYTIVERDTGSGYATVIPQYDAKAEPNQAAVPANWLLSFTGSTGASTNIHEIDNLKVCAVKPIVPIGPNHYVISHSGTGLTCEAEPVTFTAHDAGHSRANAGGRTLSISTSTSKGAWLTAADNCSSTCYNSVGGTVACAGTFTGTTGNNGQASYLFANGETGIRLCLKHNVATTVNINVSDGSASEATGSAAGEAPPGADPVLVFSDTGFRFYADGAVDAIGNLVAGLRSDVTDTTWQPSPQTIVIRALKSSETTPARCVSLLGSTAKTVQFGYECVDPNACHASSGGLEVNGAAVAGSTGAPTPASNVSVTFDGSGSGTINLKYWDVGQIKLYAQTSIADAASGDVSIVTGASNGFIVKPYGFDVRACTGSTPCTTANASATDGTGSVFAKAGEVFNATVKAVAYGGTVVTPSFGLGTGNATESVNLTPTLVAPSGAVGALGGTALPKRNAFTDGVANLSDLNWSEVGVMKINAANTLFQTVTSAATGASGNIGRFTPHHFGVTGTVVTRSDMQTSEGQVVPFTYMGEPMKLALVVTAYNKAEGVTQNYKGNFAKLDAGTLGTTVANWTCTSGTQCMGLGIVSGGNLSARLGIDTASANSAVPANTTTAGGATAGWEAGTSYFSLNMVVSRDTAADGPYRNLKFGAKPRDADGVTLPPRLSTDTAHCVNLDVGSGNENPACDPGATETNLRRKLFETDLRFGRLWLGNAYGSDQRGLAVPYETQYWNGFAFVRNADDGLTPFAVGNISRVTSLTTTLALTNLSAGRGTIDLGTPNGRGTVDVYVNLDSAGAPSNCGGHAEGTTVARSYLSGKWCGTAHDRDPVARATFGIQAGRKGPIYIRENY